MNPELLASSPRATKAGQAPRSQPTEQRSVNRWGEVLLAPGRIASAQPPSPRKQDYRPLTANIAATSFKSHTDSNTSSTHHVLMLVTIYGIYCGIYSPEEK